MDLIQGKAYKIFYSELEKHLALAKSHFFAATPPSSEEVMADRINFHKIKGGAGFFELTEIGNMAARLESALAKDDERHVAQILPQLRDLIEDLDALAMAIPKPKE